MIFSCLFFTRTKLNSAQLQYGGSPHYQYKQIVNVFKTEEQINKHDIIQSIFNSPAMSRDSCLVQKHFCTTAQSQYVTQQSHFA